MCFSECESANRWARWLTSSLCGFSCEIELCRQAKKTNHRSRWIEINRIICIWYHWGWCTKICVLQSLGMYFAKKKRTLSACMLDGMSDVVEICAKYITWCLSVLRCVQSSSNHCSQYVSLSAAGGRSWKIFTKTTKTGSISKNNSVSSCVAEKYYNCIWWYVIIILLLLSKQ